MATKAKNSRLYLLIALGIASAFGPFLTDFYLPALPILDKYFGTSASFVQLSLTFCMVGLAVGQLFIGPLSDRYGRKRPLLLSFGLFSAATIGCIYSQDIHWFILFRFVQGLAGAGGVVISKSIATDLYEGRELSMFFSLLSGVQGLAPICAPALGGFLLGVTDWKGIFWVLFVIGLLLVFILSFFKESLPEKCRQKEHIYSTFHHYIPVLHDKRFINYVLVQAFAMGVMFAYISASPFIFQTHYGLSPTAYGLCFGANAVAIMLGSFSVSFFHSAKQALKTGSVGFGLVSLIVAVTLISHAPVIMVESILFLFLIFLGLILPSSTALALDEERDSSGYASALLGFLTFLFGGIISPLTGVGDMLDTTSIIIVACCLGVGWCTRKATSDLVY